MNALLNERCLPIRRPPIKSKHAMQKIKFNDYLMRSSRSKNPSELQ